MSITSKLILRSKNFLEDESVVVLQNDQDYYVAVGMVFS